MNKIVAHMHNKFELSLKRDGKVLQRAYAENVVLDKIWEAFGATYTDVRMFYSYMLGTGSGTPSASDTALFSQQFEYAGLTEVSRTIGYPTSTLVMSASIPATAAYTGSLTEIGLRMASRSYNPSYWLITHAMLKDSEGNPITITKTDLDILEITSTVYCSFSTAVDGFTLVPAASNNVLSRLKISSSSGGPFSTSHQGGLLAQACVPADNYATGFTLSLSDTYDASTRTLAYTFGRVASSQGNTHYYNGLRLDGWGYIRFPNATFFPSYAISNMAVGVGDGATTTFRPPLNLFVENSEIVYVNGVAKTRNTDYTIDHNGNVDKMLSASAGNRASITQQATSSTSVVTARPFSIGTMTNAFYISADTPMILHLDDADTTIGKKVNCISLGYMCFTGLASYSHAGLRFIASYSNDGATWTEAGTLTVSTTTTDTAFGDIPFTAVEANYWKIALDVTGIVNSTVRNWSTTRSLYQTTSGMTFLGYVGNGLNFTSPPAANDIITMTASVDRPFKNENFVIDMTTSLVFAGS